MDTENLYKKFEQYYRGTMAEVDKSNFQKQLGENIELQKAYESFRTAELAIELGTIKQLKTKLKKKEAQPLKSRYLIPFRIVATILMLIFVGLTLYKVPQFTNDKLTSSRIDEKFIERERSTSIDNNRLGNIQNLLNDQRYEEAMEALQAVPDTVNYYPYLLNLKGMTALKLEKFEIAIGFFQTLIELEDPRFSESARWHQAMAYLRNGQENEAIQTLNTMSNDSNHAYIEDAALLLKDLNSFWRWIH